MNQHQILTGAVNAGDSCYSVGSVEGVPFTAYSAGCNIVILASDFSRVQIIPGILHGNVQVACLDCSTDVGKIAVAYGKKIRIFEPTPLLENSSLHKLDYKWIETASLDSDCTVSVISWSLEGTKLLTGGISIQMWHLVTVNEEAVDVTGGGEKSTMPGIVDPENEVKGMYDEHESERMRWDCVWRCRTASPVSFLRFSPDGVLFVSAGKADRLVKIWYESAAKISYMSQSGNGLPKNSAAYHLSEVNYSFIYIAHPRAITGITWRKMSKYTPRGCNANILVSSCRDNICRIWVQTLLPDDGLVNFCQIEGMEKNTVPRIQTRRHRQKILERIKHMKSFNQFKKRQAVATKGADSTDDANHHPIPNLPSTYSVHDFHTFGIHGTAMTPGLHFHLAASINAETDIPLVPSLSGVTNDSKEKPRFIMHWLNNKEMVFTQEAEKMLHEMSTKVFQAEQAQASFQQSEAGESEPEGDGLEESINEEYDADSTLTAESGKKLRHKLCQKPKDGKGAKKGDGKENVQNAQNVDNQDKESHHSKHSTHTVSSTASLNTDIGSNNEQNVNLPPLGDILDRKFEALLRDWHTSSDLLFSIHPVDGSLLVWLVEWLDETSPGTFRQAQVSFSSRIPSAIPLTDASTMSHNIALYSPYSYLDLRNLLPSSVHCNLNEKGGDLQQRPARCPSLSTLPTPTVFMISKHSNGTLNQWALTFGEMSSFTQVLSVSHGARVSGHRFRVNDISCHPVLPLLLTTSHHNLPGASINFPKSPLSSTNSTPAGTPSPSNSMPEFPGVPNAGFCSELILWRVDPVGPLSKSGGITELARINSPDTSAFANVAWIPTLLPSSTLGSIANSPSACFIASDGHQLRVYQAVIDARTLLAEMSAAERRSRTKHRDHDHDHDLSMSMSEDDNSSDAGMFKHNNLQEAFRVVSLQSTSRPGCILELSGIEDAVHDWQNTQLLHVFQDQLIRGDKAAYQVWSEKQDIDSPSLVEPSLGAVVDLRHSAVFEEPFYLVVLEKNDRGMTLIHMWKLVISSQTSSDVDNDKYTYVPDSNLIQDSDHSNQTSRSGTPDASGKHDAKDPASVSPLKITTSKVCTQVLELANDVEVIHACPAAGHLSSSNIYPACFAPYLICTACSDGQVRFWRCQIGQEKDVNVDGEGEGEGSHKSYEWVEWEMLLNRSSSAIEVPGLPLYVSCAYSGRIACAYKHGQSFSRPTSKLPNARYININLAIYECESTGGSEWVLEDTIKLRNVNIPSTDLHSGMGIDLGSLVDASLKNRRTADTLMQRLTSDDPSENRTHNIQRLLSVPSYTTMQSLRKIIAEQGNQFTLTQKSIVRLDWVSTEDGSHVLTVSVGSQISVFTPVSTDIAQANLQAMKASSKTGTTTTSRMLLKQASSMAMPSTQPDDIRWMAFRTTQLTTADGLPPLPMQMSWVRDGILVVGMDNEMHIYTQWKNEKEPLLPIECVNENEIVDTRVLTEKGLLSHAQETSHLRLPIVPGLGRSPSASILSNTGSSLSLEKAKQQPKDEADISSTAHHHVHKDEDKELSLSDLPDFGIFEASRLACPVLPQYHPKQLMELLAFGKVHRVRAILSHLVIALCSMDSLKDYVQQQQQQGQRGSEADRSPRPYQRSRTLSIAGPTSPGVPSPIDPEGGRIPEEVQLNYTEITSIRPLPLFTLVDAEFEKPIVQVQVQDKQAGRGGRESAMEEAESGYGGLFDSGTKSQVEETLDEILNRSTYAFNKPQKQEKLTLNSFGPRQARLLTKLLTHSHLPGLSSLDQMHLLALGDAVASFNPSLELSRQGKDDHLLSSDSAPEETPHHSITADSLDDCGLRFLLTMRQHTYLLRCLPIVQRRQLHREGLNTCNLVWAFHSETQEELVQIIKDMQRGNIKWSTLREIGVGWWIRNNAILKRLIEHVAKSAFQQKQDPLDAALFYLAMKKKSLVWGLYRSVQDRKMMEFFQNNFAEDKWRKAALKNAYALLGKQRFEHAAAFFLLAGNVWDAVEICMSKLDDIQLAIVIIRLFDGDIETVPENLKKLLYLNTLGCKADGSEHMASKAHPDPFLRSMAYWTLQDYTSSLTTLLESEVGYDHQKNLGHVENHEDLCVHPSVFNFYLYLRTHPLIVRRHLAQNAQSDKKDRKDKNESCSDAITPFERRLFFITAHQHFRAGCPSLALEVLSRLPNRIVSEDALGPILNKQDSIPQHAEDVATGILDKSDTFDWSAPAPVLKDAPKNLDMDFDWGAPVTNLGSVDTSDFKVDITIDSGSEDNDDDDNGLEMSKKPKPVDLEGSKQVKLDIMAQQLKFIACLKIIMEELSTLATGYEVDGGQLRYYLYVWLEKTVNALKTICNTRTFSMRGTKYQSVDGHHNSSMALDDLSPRDSHSEASAEPKPTLHEILLADKMDFEAKLERATKRKDWLRGNEALLRTLLSYCSLHGAHGGGLASVRMELILLLQELQQERSQHQLLSPLPFPTTLPLLAASVACQKTVIADPIRHLHAITNDVLQSVVELKSPPLILPANYSQVYVLRDLGISLSACIYQSLCDSENLLYKGPMDQEFLDSSVVCPNSHLLAGHHTALKRSSTLHSEPSEPVVPTTPANKWPGVQSLRALLARDKDEDSPKLHTLLCEAYVAVYSSQLIYAFAACDSHMLYRLVSQKFSDKDWASLFGGGAKKLIHVAVTTKTPQPSNQGSRDTPVPEDSPGIDLLNTLSKQRMKLHMKILQQLNQDEKPADPVTIKEDRPTYREQFVPPHMSILSCLMSKPNLPDELVLLDYDSGESVASDDENVEETLDEFGTNDSVFGEVGSGNAEEAEEAAAKAISDHEQYAWGMIRSAAIRLAQLHLVKFLTIAGIELPELPTTSPLIHAIFKTTNVWAESMKSYMSDFEGPPSHFLPNSYVETARQPGGPAILKYKALLEPTNTPFKSHNKVTKPAKRLWNFLVRQEKVQDIFVRYVFGKPKSAVCLGSALSDAGDETESKQAPLNTDSVRIVHKDQDSISGFCVNRANPGIIAISTPKEVQEVDMSVLLEPVPWLEEEAEYDIMNLLKAPESLPMTNYLVVQHPSDKLQTSPGLKALQSQLSLQVIGTPQPQPAKGTVMSKHHFVGNTNPQFCEYVIERSRHILKPLRRHKTEGTRRLCAHPVLPIYVSGSQDGSVNLWEWNHQQLISTARPAGTFAKVTHAEFNQQGNKFGITDGDGNLSLWQVANTSQKPYFSKQVHSKNACDFTFLGSSSLIVTAGQSTDHRNVCMWDTLLPSKKSMVTSFACHETHGASALLFAPLNQLLITGGKKGDVFIFDMRQRTQKHKLQAHESAVKCMALDPGEEFFVTGSADGDIKVWSLGSVHMLLYSYIGEHSRSTLFRNLGMGVSHLYVDATGRLYSCGADGSMKLRQLPDRNTNIVLTL